MKLSGIAFILAVMPLGSAFGGVEVVESGELDIVTYTILGEARGEGFKGMACVAQIILNRARHSGKSLKETCLSSKQFSFWNGRKTEKYLDELTRIPQYPKARKLAYYVLSGENVSPEIGNSRHYHSISVKPIWSKKSNVKIRIGNHIFYEGIL